MLRAIKRALKNGQIYCKIESVARSGMSRKVRFYIALKGEIVEITNHLRIIKANKGKKLADIEYRLENWIKWDDSAITLQGLGLDLPGYFLQGVGKILGKNLAQCGWYYRVL